MPERDRLGDLRHRRREVEIGGGIEDRIAAEDDERLDRARLHRGDEGRQRAHARKRRVLRLVVADRLARIAEKRVQRADRGVDGRGLTIARDDQSLAAVGLKILGEGVDPARVHTRDTAARHTTRGRSEACRERGEERGDLTALEPKPMIGHRSGERVDPFDRVEPVHLTTGTARAPSSCEASRVAEHLGVAEQRVGVESENHRRLIEAEHEIDVAPRGGPQSREPVLVADRVVGRPLQPGSRRSKPGAPEWGEKDRTGLKASAAILRAPGRAQAVTGPPRFPRALQCDRLRRSDQRPSTDAWTSALQAPSVEGARGVPRFVGRPSWPRRSAQPRPGGTASSSR